MVRQIRQFREKVNKADLPPEEITQCKKYACSFQRCLNKRNHDVEQCRGYFDAWEDCAKTVRENIAKEQEEKG